MAKARTWKSTVAQMAHWSFPAPPPWQLDDWQEATPVNFASSTGGGTAEALRHNTRRPATARCQVERTDSAYIKLRIPAN
jgi:hypothetical protein